MKKYLSLLVALIATMLATSSFAFTPPPAPPNGWYVSDQAGKLSSKQITQINHKIERVSKATKNEFGILLLQDMGGENIEDVANATFKAWGIGKRGLDNGCLIVVAIKERKSRIETGKGVEGEVTDLQANDILKKNLNPHLKKGDFAGGFLDTLDALSSLIESRHNKKAEPPPKSQVVGGCDVAGSPGSYGLTMAAVIVVLTALLLGLRAFSKYRLKKEAERFRKVEAEMAAEKAARLARAGQLRLAEEQKARRMEEEAYRQRATKPDRRRPVLPPPQPPKKVVSSIAATVVASEAILEVERAKRKAAALEAEREARARREREEAKQEQEERARRRRRQQEEEDRRRKDQEEEDDRRRKRDSESSSSFWDSGSSSGGGFDGGSGFGGGDSGGGGSSSDW